MSNVGATLLKLLQQVDAERLEVLLDAHVMLHLLRTASPRSSPARRGAR